MALRSLRIRHYLGAIVAACTLGGLLLAIELAFLFVSLESRARDVRSHAANLATVEGWCRSMGALVADARASVDAPGITVGLDERARELLVDIQRISDRPENEGLRPQLGRLRQHTELVLQGVQQTARLRSPTISAESLATARQNFDWLLEKAAQSFAEVQGPLRAELDESTSSLDASRGHLWRTVGFSAFGYAFLVVVLWRWVVLRLLRPLQSLTEDSRRTLDGVSVLSPVSSGPYEVRQLSEDLSRLVQGLIGARGSLEEKVRERTLELERANQAKNEFLANMSHEIRTPMTAILGYAELILAPELPEGERHRYAEIIHANGEHLLSVINDILDVSKIEAGRMTVEPTVCSPFEVVSEVRALMEVRAASKDLELSVENHGPIPDVVRTDPTRLRQILLNLVNNAIKFTEQGRVLLTFSLEARPEGGALLAFEVRDTGVGMTDQEIERVFRPFVQADTTTTRKYGGSGLGLTISRTLARMLGGDLTCSSEIGKGSSFRVTIDPGPLEGVRLLERLPEAALPERTAHRTWHGPAPHLEGRVLLAEDVAVNRRLIATLLRRTGIAVVEAENGRVAMEKALAADTDGRPFDIVFMDMQMPEMDGYEATERMRRAGYTRAIVALTSHSMTGERQRCLAVGCDEYMTKPVDRRVLLQTLGRFLAQRPANSTA